MPTLITKNPDSRQWRLLLVYDFYRLISIFLFLGIYLFSPIKQTNSYIYCSILFVYFLCGVLFLCFWRFKKVSFDKQVFISGTLDVIAISTMLLIIGNMQSGYGILLNVTIFALSILAPGRLAIFFAALASCLLLGGNSIQYFFNEQKDISLFFYSGIYGAGFFGTAITAWYMAYWVRISEGLARHRSEELAGMQRVNEYIVERLHSGVIYVDVDKEIKLINSAARQFLDVNEDRTPQYLQELSPLLAEKFDNFLQKTKQRDTTAQTLLEDPYLRVHFFSTTVANKPAVLIILEDMTFISQQAQQLKLAALGRFSASIAHELRNPLGAIAHAAQLFGEVDELNEEDIRLKQLILKNCGRMNEVIKNVLQLSRREKANPQLIEMTGFLEQFRHDFCLHNACDFTIKYPKDNAITVPFDKSQLEQILVILCENSMQHGRDEEGNLSINVSLKSTDYNNVLFVSDSGEGVPPELTDSIFEPFFTTLRTGTGMGLFIAKDLCEINQARLSLEKSTKGSCFAITLNTSDELII